MASTVIMGALFVTRQICLAVSGRSRQASSILLKTVFGANYFHDQFSSHFAA